MRREGLLEAPEGRKLEGTIGFKTDEITRQSGMNKDIVASNNILLQTVYLEIYWPKFDQSKISFQPVYQNGAWKLLVLVIVFLEI